jgi:hypothetical protein
MNIVVLTPMPTAIRQRSDERLMGVVISRKAAGPPRQILRIGTHRTLLSRIRYISATSESIPWGRRLLGRVL